MQGLALLHLYGRLDTCCCGPLSFKMMRQDKDNPDQSARIALIFFPLPFTINIHICSGLTGPQIKRKKGEQNELEISFSREFVRADLTENTPTKYSEIKFVGRVGNVNGAKFKENLRAPSGCLQF